MVGFHSAEYYSQFSHIHIHTHNLPIVAVRRHVINLKSLRQFNTTKLGINGTSFISLDWVASSNYVISRHLNQ